jgi:RNA polymerase sigma factor for flagellar operon FliA
MEEENPVLSQLWKNYIDDRTVENRNALALEYLPFVRSCSMSFGFGYQKMRDMLGPGAMGLLQAIERFDPEHGVPFKQYARRRVIGAIKDALREDDWLSRNARDALGEYFRSINELTAKHGKTPKTSEVMEAVKSSTENPSTIVFRVSSAIGFAESKLEPVDWTSSITDESRGTSPHESGDLTFLGDFLGTLVSQLPEQEKIVTNLLWFEDLTQHEVGEVLGVSASRISQINVSSLKLLRESLSSCGIRSTYDLI